MSPTVFKEGPYRFFFFSREEPRKHVHITCSEGEAKFWIEPIISLAIYSGLSKSHLKKMQILVENHLDEINQAWKNTSRIDLNITQFGIWLCFSDEEFFLSYKDYPFFKDALLKHIYHVELLHKTHLYWPDLDIDLSVGILKNPHHFPLIAR